MTITKVESKKISITEHEYKALFTVLDMLEELRADIGSSNAIQTLDSAQEVIEMEDLNKMIRILYTLTDDTERIVEII